MGVQTRIPRKGKIVLSAGSGEVAFYEVAFPAGLRFSMHHTIKWVLNFYGICPAQLSPNAWRNINSVLVIWRFHRRHFSLNEFRCLYTLLKGPGSESGWLYFKARPGKNILKGAPSNVKGWKRIFFFVSRDDWEFHPTNPYEQRVVRVPRSWGAPGKQCNKVLVLSPTEEERFRQIFEKIGEGHFKLPVILNSRTYYKYFAPSRVEVSSSSGGMAEGDISGEAKGDIRGEAATAGHASESSRSIDVSRPDAPSRENSVEFVGTIGEEMRRIFIHASDLDLLGRSEERDRDPFLGPPPSSVSSSSCSRLGSQSDSGLFPELRSDAMPKRIKLSELAKVAAQKAATLSSKGMVISEGSEMASKKRASDDGSKGKQVTPLPEAKKIKLAMNACGPYEAARSSRGGQLNETNPCRDFAEGALNQRALTESSKMEMVRVQNRAIELEGALAKKKAKGKKATEEVEARNEVVASLEARVTELEKSQSLSAGRIITAFKESDNFLEAVMGSASSYFSNGFDFCKRQLTHHYPNLGVDLEDIEMDQDFLSQEEIEAERKAAKDKREVEARGEKKGD
ncbi:hypothetical protein Acr_18g0007610 [Actinidia rufa]|uniref:Uncharacterized protein n=1 Tax=Actinidia rufa TaxID=165716 RepID=A0A7J0G735_9ERIC|nr:hypothetical protein Acr_18g0007610 [Actinidia rufa]